MIIFLFMFLLFPTYLKADIFSKPTDQILLDEALLQDVKSNYYRGSYDYNASAVPDTSTYLWRKDGVSSGSNRFDFNESLSSFMLNQDLDESKVELILNKLALPSSKLLFWQYSSPSVADLYKHFHTLGQLRLAMRYQQYQDFEQSLNDPLMQLRKQAIMNCVNLQQKRTSNDFETAMKVCIARSNDLLEATPFMTLGKPLNSDDYLENDSIYLIEEILTGIKLDREDIDKIKEIVSEIVIRKNFLEIKKPLFRSRQLIAKYRKEYFEKLDRIVTEYKTSKTFNKERLSLWVSGVPMTESQIKNLALLDQQEGVIAINKIASNLAYLTTMDQYLLASEVLQKLMTHPVIQSGYKALLQSSLDYVRKEAMNLKEERARLSQYADAMRSILNEADISREKTMKQISAESEDKAKQRLFSLSL